MLTIHEGKIIVILIPTRFFNVYMTSVRVSSEIKPEPLDDNTEEFLPS